MDRPTGTRWTLEGHRRAPDLDGYGPLGTGVSEQQLLAQAERASLCRCGHPKRWHASGLGACLVDLPDVTGRLHRCPCHAYDPELPGELAEEYGR